MYALHYREELPQPVVKELDDFIAWLHGYLGRSLNEDGTLKLATPSGAGASSNTDTFLDQVEAEEGHWWKKGPWIFDRESSHVAIIYTPSLPAQTINNFAPGGVETCVGIEINLAGNITITGLKAPDRNFRRLVFIRNQSSTYTVTLKHQNTGSNELNRFALPNSVDIVMGTQQTTWLYYDADNRRWTSFITGNTSGGLVGAATTTLPGGISADLVKTRVVLTDAQIKSLNTSPVTVIAAPGAGFTIHVVSVMYEKNTLAAIYSGNPTLSLRYNGITLDIDAAVAVNLNVSSRNTRINHASSLLTSDTNNKAVTIRSSGDVTGGNASNYIVVSVVYCVVADGP